MRRMRRASCRRCSSVFPILGLTVFSAESPSRAHGRAYFLDTRGVKAEGRETAEGFLVKEGSRAVAAETPTCHNYIRELRAALLKNGVLRASGKDLVFTQDYLFASPERGLGGRTGTVEQWPRRVEGTRRPLAT